MAVTVNRSKKAPRSVPSGAPKVPKLVENGSLIIPKRRGGGRKGKSKPSFLGYRRENGRVGIRN